MRAIVLLVATISILSFWGDNEGIDGGMPLACQGLKKEAYNAIRLCRRTPYEKWTHISYDYYDRLARHDVPVIADIPDIDNSAEFFADLPAETVQRLQKHMQKKQNIK